MSRVLKVNVMLPTPTNNFFYEAGAVEGLGVPLEHAAMIGDHAWSEVAEPVAVARPVVMREQHIVPAEPSVEVLLDKDTFLEDERPQDLDLPPEPDPEIPGPVTAAGPPPLAGPGSSAKAWREYAAENSVDLAEDAKRDDVIEALRAANIPTE